MSPTDIIQNLKDWICYRQIHTTEMQEVGKVWLFGLNKWAVVVRTFSNVDAPMKYLMKAAAVTAHSLALFFTTFIRYDVSAVFAYALQYIARPAW